MLKVQNISFSYHDKKTIQKVSFDLEKGKNAAVIGESGCGKSTLLKLIYGLYDLGSGEISWNNNVVLGPKFNLIPGMENMKYLAQDFDLMPFISVAENIGKYLSNTNIIKKRSRIVELLALVEMTDFYAVKAQFLSGGQMQRVALARVLASEPELLLLDEPFSHIDNFRKNSLCRKLFRYLKEKQITTIFATHDSLDVLCYADEVLVLKEGKIMERGMPKNIYENPKNKYTASLFGDVNEIKMDNQTRLIYPHQLIIVDRSDLKVEVISSYFVGSYYLIESNYEKGKLFFESKKAIPIGSKIYLKKT